jgi:hypothetical protein
LLASDCPEWSPINWLRKLKRLASERCSAKLHQIATVLLNTTGEQIIIATLIGITIAYYLMQIYLKKYSERISLQWWHFTTPILILVVIMFSTIASVLWKAARNNPVESLRTE